MDRAHRIGQKKQVFVFRFVTEVSVAARRPFEYILTLFYPAVCRLP